MSPQAGKGDPTPEQRLKTAGLVLPKVPEPVGRFLAARRAGNLLFLSGQGPLNGSGVLSKGTVGADVSVDQARADARLTGLVLLSAIRSQLGSLDEVDFVVRLFGMVNAIPGFTDHPKVIDGCSELLLEVFGDERGRHARTSVGVGSLPDGITVEIEAVVSARG